MKDTLLVDGEPFLTVNKGAVSVSIRRIAVDVSDLHRPVHQVQIQIRDTQIVQRLVQRRLNILRRMLGIPQLAGQEDLLARHTRVLDSLADFRLVAIDSSAVDVTISLSQGGFNRALDFVWGSLPGAESDGGDLGAGVEGEVGREGHFVWNDILVFEQRAMGTFVFIWSYGPSPKCGYR